MRTAIVSVLLAATGCTSSTSPPSTASSVRTRLQATTALFVVASDSSGDVTASHDTETGWQAGTSALAIADGELDASVDDDGNLAIDAFAVDVQPIALPLSVFGTAATLEDVGLRLVTATAANAIWADPDDATATGSLVFELQWSIEVNGDLIPLGAPQLPPLPTTISLTGSGETVDATIGIATPSSSATGPLWTWADLLQLNALELSLTATSDS